jgi:hypothetical protein
MKDFVSALHRHVSVPFGRRLTTAQPRPGGRAKCGALRYFNRVLAEHHAEQAYKRDQRRGWGPRLNKALGEPL